MASEAAQITPLAERLISRLRATGPISVADYMAEVSAFYYGTRDPFGAAGDFITAPEVSQVFGELIGAWCADYWQRLGAPDPVLLVELGPGRGTLLADALRATRHVPGFHAALRLHLVERSPVLRRLQQAKLATFAPVFHDSTALFAPMERDSAETLPHAPMLLIANEFLDALPIEQFVRCKTGWHERKVGLGEDGKSLVFCLAENATLLGGIPDDGLFARAADGDVVESCPAAEQLSENLGVRLRRYGGVALFVDYARAPSPYGDTLQAVQHHHSHAILGDPGSADLTAHVDFRAVADAAEYGRAQAHGPVTQRDFLLQLGLEERKAKLLERATLAQAQAIETGCHRLIDPQQMGTLFKVLALTRRGAPVPAGFVETKMILRDTLLDIPGINIPGIRHGFFTREGGVSEGIFASLNCSLGSGDDVTKVAENRRRALAQLGLGPDQLVTCYQIHGADVVVVEKPWKHEDRPRADAMVTRLKGVALGILTADCAPVLFADEEAGVIAAAHAGWRGALTGVIAATVAAMESEGARRARIKAMIGPCIGFASYEVGPEFPAPFLAQSPEHAAFFRAAPRAGHHLFDLSGYVRARLAAAGVTWVYTAGGDTAAEPQRFFSYRRTCLAGEKQFGHELSAICLAP